MKSDVETAALKKSNDVVVNEQDWVNISRGLRLYEIWMLMWSSVWLGELSGRI